MIGPLGETLIAAGLVHNSFLLELNHGLTNPDAVPMPSRLFRFPIEYVEPTAPGGERILLRHPDLQDLPFVHSITAKIGVVPGWEDADKFGRDRGSLPRWWHAVDLCYDKHWRDLLATQNFTTPANIFHAVAFHLHCGGISLQNARRVLAALGSREPADRSEAALKGPGLSPSTFTHDEKNRPFKTARHAINVIHMDSEAEAWMFIHGLEGGWFERGAHGHAHVTEWGMARRAAKAAPWADLPLFAGAA